MPSADRPDIDQIAAGLLAERFAHPGEPYLRTPPDEDSEAACLQRCRELLAAVDTRSTHG